MSPLGPYTNNFELSIAAEHGSHVNYVHCCTKLWGLHLSWPLDTREAVIIPWFNGIGTQPKVSQGSYHNIQLTNLCMILRLTKLFIAYSQRLAYWHIMDLAVSHNLKQSNTDQAITCFLLYVGYNIAHNIQHCPALPCTWWPWAQACSVSRMPLSCHVPFQHWQPLQLPTSTKCYLHNA